jgi:dTDP-4-amino-4,6-dideoxygalactose transaminase
MLFARNDRATDSVVAEFRRILSSSRFVDGEQVAQLERDFRDVSGVSAVATRSGMDALELLLETIDPKWGNNVVVPANCFQSIPALVVRSGLRPVPIDIDRRFRSPMVDALVVRPPAVMLWVHHCGTVHPGAGEQIQDLRSRGYFVIEDFAYGIPQDGRPDGDVSMLTFAPTKPFGGTSGAMLLVRDDKLAHRLAGRRSHGGQEVAWEGGEAFFRARGIDEVSALLARLQYAARASLRSHLHRLQEAYVSSVAACERIHADVLTCQVTQGRLPMLLSEPIAGAVCKELREQNIAASVMYGKPWFDYPWFRERCPSACEAFDPESIRAYVRRLLCLPLHSRMSTVSCARIVNAIANIVRR